jgi:hypothetical protein
VTGTFEHGKETRRQRSIEIPKCAWEDNIKMDSIEIICVGVDWN